MMIESLQLPGSGCVVEWRPDRRWRRLDHQQSIDELFELHHPEEDEWMEWTGEESRHLAITGPRPGSIWVVFCEEFPTEAVDPLRVSEASVEISRVGDIRVCEWPVEKRLVTVSTAKGDWDVDMARIYSEPPPSITPDRGAT